MDEEQKKVDDAWKNQVEKEKKEVPEAAAQPGRSRSFAGSGFQFFHYHAGGPGIHSFGRDG